MNKIVMKYKLGVYGNIDEGLLGDTWDFLWGWIKFPFVLPFTFYAEVKSIFVAIMNSLNVSSAVSPDKLSELGFDTNVACNSILNINKAVYGFFNGGTDKSIETLAVVILHTHVKWKNKIRMVFYVTGSGDVVLGNKLKNTFEKYLLYAFDSAIDRLRISISKKDIAEAKRILAFTSYNYFIIHNHPKETIKIKGLTGEEAAEATKIFNRYVCPSSGDTELKTENRKNWYCSGEYVIGDGFITKYADENGKLSEFQCYLESQDKIFPIVDYEGKERRITVPPFTMVFPYGKLAYIIKETTAVTESENGRFSHLTLKQALTSWYALIYLHNTLEDEYREKEMPDNIYTFFSKVKGLLDDYTANILYKMKMVFEDWIKYFKVHEEETYNRTFVYIASMYKDIFEKKIYGESISAAQIALTIFHNHGRMLDYLNIPINGIVQDEVITDAFLTKLSNFASIVPQGKDYKTLSKIYSEYVIESKV